MGQAVSATLSSIVDQASHLAGSRRASLMLPAADADELRVIAATGLPAVIASAARVRVGKPVSGVVAKTRQPILCNHADRRGARRAATYQTGAYISVPVPLADAGCGALNVADPIAGRTFDEGDLTRVEAFGQTIGHDLAFAQAQRRIQHLAAEVRRLQVQIVQAQEEERRRIARELHDEAGHALTAAIFRLDLESTRLPAEAASARSVLGTARDSLLECATTLHDIAFALRPRILEDLGLSAALRSLARQAMAADGLEVTLAVDGQERPLDKGVELAVFRVVQEALTNTRKHARATQAAIRLSFHPHVLLVQIEDNGSGIGAPEAGSPRRPGLGLAGMRERIEVLDGVFEIGARQGGGTRIAMQVPLEPHGDGNG